VEFDAPADQVCVEFRAGVVPFAAVAAHWPIVANLLAEPARRAVECRVGDAGGIANARSCRGSAGARPWHNSVNRVAGQDSSGGNRCHCRCRSQTRADIKLAGGLSLTVSLPTMIVAFTRHRHDRSFAGLGQNRSLVLARAARSIVGSFTGDRLLGLVPSPVLLAII
jgi:uncharacterized protein